MWKSLNVCTVIQRAITTAGYIFSFHWHNSVIINMKHMIIWCCFFLLVTLCSDNHNNSLFLGDKRPYLSLPRPGVSIIPSILMNILMIQSFVISAFSPQKHSANLKTAKAVKLDAEVAYTANTSGSTIHHVTSCTLSWQQYIHLQETLCHSVEELMEFVW